MSQQRMKRLIRSGVPPSVARKPTLLDGWDVVRAARHMLEIFGEQAVATAERRADAAADVDLVRRWRAIAATIRELAEGSSPAIADRRTAG